MLFECFEAVVAGILRGDIAVENLTNRDVLIYESLIYGRRLHKITPSFKLRGVRQRLFGQLHGVSAAITKAYKWLYRCKPCCLHARPGLQYSITGLWGCYADVYTLFNGLVSPPKTALRISPELLTWDQPGNVALRWLGGGLVPVGHIVYSWHRRLQCPCVWFNHYYPEPRNATFKTRIQASYITKKRSGFNCVHILDCKVKTNKLPKQFVIDVDDHIASYQRRSDDY